MNNLSLRPMPMKVGSNISGHGSDLAAKRIEARIVDLVREYSSAASSDYRHLDPGMNPVSIKGSLSADLDTYNKALGINIVGHFKGLITTVMRELKPAILDIGPGLAVAARQIQSELGNSADVVGLDIFEFDQADAEPQLQKIPVIIGMAESLPFRDRELFNMVLAHQSIYDPVAPFALLDEVTRVLLPGGSAFLEIHFPDFGKVCRFYEQFFKFMKDISEKTGQEKECPFVKVKKLPKSAWFNVFLATISKPAKNIPDNFFSNIASDNKFPLFFLD